MLNWQKVSQREKLFIWALLVFILIGEIYFLKKSAGTLPNLFLPKQTLAPKDFVPVQINPSAWLTYTNKAYKYSISYPPEFKVEDRGKVKDIVDLVAFSYLKDGKTVTVAKVELHNEKAPVATKMFRQKGVDGNGNKVAIYYVPYSQNQSLVLVGTVYPTLVGGNFQFAAVLDQMAQSLQVNK